MPENDAEHREIEAKFDVDARGRAVLLDLESSGEFRVTQRSSKFQRDVYYDTRDSALARHGVTLRVRRVGEKTVMTFKGDLQRSAVAGESHVASRVEDEVAVPFEAAAGLDDENTLPPSLDLSPVRRARALAPSGDLLPVARLENDRTTLALVDGAGGSLELAIDHVRGTRLSDGRVVEFDEVELESKTAGRAAVLRAADELRRRVPGLEPSYDTKLGRTLE